uniref:hypothetical protein n=1 Tax=[Lactobacillus] rogosae TaxID=706562 RepID=UPI00402AB7A0
MSVSIRISDDMYYEIMKLKADKVSINKTVDMLLGLALKGIEKCEMNISSSDEAGNDNTDFPERVKKISEYIFEELKESYDVSIESENENENSQNEESENENSKMHIQDLEKQISDFQKSEEHFLKIENELSEISKLIFENRKLLDEKIQSTEDDLSSPSIDWTTLVTPPPEMYYNITADRTEYPYILPDDVKPWSYMKWKIKEEYKTATLEFSSNIIAVADFLHQKIMIANILDMQVWYQQTADSLENLMLICERRVLKTFNGELPLWFKTGIQFTHNTDYNSQLYAKQEEINEERKRRGLYEFECFRF